MGVRYLVRHDVAEQHDVPRVDAHTVALHGVVDLVDDGLPRSFDTENLGYLDDVVGRSVLSDDACQTCNEHLIDAGERASFTLRCHDLLQTVTLYK